MDVADESATKVQSTCVQSDNFGRLCRLKDLNAKAPEELKAYCECMDYYRYMCSTALSTA